LNVFPADNHDVDNDDDDDDDDDGPRVLLMTFELIDIKLFPVYTNAFLQACY